MTDIPDEVGDEQHEGNPEFDSFRVLTSKLLKVPKKEADERRKAEDRDSSQNGA